MVGTTTGRTAGLVVAAGTGAATVRGRRCGIRTVGHR